MKRIIIILLSVVLLTTLSGCCVFHEWEDATCTRARTCTKCGVSVGEPLGHSEGEWTVELEQTCETEGIKVKTCSVCKEVLEKETLIALGHTGGDWVIAIEANCTSAGKDAILCQTCGKELKSRSVNKKEHKLSDWIIDVNVTCTANGRRHRECVNCGKTIISEEIRTAGHSCEDWVVDEKNTCTKDGQRHGNCTVCGQAVSEIIPATGHTVEGIKCTVCGEYVITVNKTDKNYTDVNGLTVKVTSFSTYTKSGTMTISIEYVIKNNVKKSKLMPGSFVLFYEDGSCDYQYGFFNYLTYGESDKRSYSWTCVDDKKVLAVEYIPDGQESTLSKTKMNPDAMHWISPKNKSEKDIMTDEARHLDEATGYCSRIQLISAMLLKGYSEKNATYAVDHCGADYKANAVNYAKQLIAANYGASYFNKSVLHNAMISAGFTEEQVQYGIEKSGYTGK